MEERLNAFYTKGAAGSRCLAVRIINSKETRQDLAFMAYKCRRRGWGREKVKEKKEELACLSLLMWVNNFSLSFVCFYILVLLGRIGAL